MMREQSGATENKDRYGHTLKERGEGKRKVTDHPAASDHMDDSDILFHKANSLKAQGQALDAADLYALVIDITLPGPTFAGRYAVTHLTNVGLTDWLCGNQKAYVKLARSWSKRLDKLAVLRAQLRDQVAASSLCDAPLFARNFEAALRDMWRHWCQAQQNDRKAGQSNLCDAHYCRPRQTPLRHPFGGG